MDLKDRAMRITFHPEADHTVSVVHSAEFKHGRITVRFQLPDKENSIEFNVADQESKEVHAAHLCMVKINT